MTSFAFPSNPISKRVNMIDAAVDGLDAEVGLTPAHKRNAKAVLDTLAAGRTAEETAGITANGKGYQVDHVERDGDVRKIYAHRRNESGFFEKIVVHEEQASDGAYVSSEVRHGR